MIVNSREVTDRKQLEANLERQVQRLTALRDIDLAITASLDLRVALNTILDQVIAQLAPDAVDVLLTQADGQSLRYAAGRGFTADLVAGAASWRRLEEGLAGHVAHERQWIHVDDLASDERVSRADLVADEGFVTYDGVPLIVKGDVKGVLEVYHRSAFEPPTDWISFLEALAGQTAIAVDNAALFEGLQRAHVDLVRAYDKTLEGWVTALDLRDKETQGHSRRVTETTLELARAMGVSDDQLAHIRRGALLHDIGKLAVPDSILHKPGPLTDEEMAVMREHPVHAYAWLSPIEFLRPALDIPYCHHERWDGAGYPRGLQGEQIPLAARIFAVVDAYDAMTRDRPYREAAPHEAAIDELRAGAGTQFDPDVVETFIRTFG